MSTYRQFYPDQQYYTGAATINVPADYPTLELAYSSLVGLVLNTDVTIQVAAGVYTSAGYIFVETLGIGNVHVLGDTVTPTNVTINTTGSYVVTQHSKMLFFGGFNIVAAVTQPNGLSVDQGSSVRFVGDCSFTNFTTALNIVINSFCNASGGTLTFVNNTNDILCQHNSELLCTNIISTGLTGIHTHADKAKIHITGNVSCASGLHGLYATSSGVLVCDATTVNINVTSDAIASSVSSSVYLTNAACILQLNSPLRGIFCAFGSSVYCVGSIVASATSASILVDSAAVTVLGSLTATSGTYGIYATKGASCDITGAVTLSGNTTSVTAVDTSSVLINNPLNTITGAIQRGINAITGSSVYYTGTITGCAYNAMAENNAVIQLGASTVSELATISGMHSTIGSTILATSITSRNNVSGFTAVNNGYIYAPLTNINNVGNTTNYNLASNTASVDGSLITWT